MEKLSKVDVQITKVKFYRRNTIIFRSDGQIDFIGSNNVVYSSRNIDFETMRWEPVTSPSVLKRRKETAPKLLDVIFDEHDLLLVANNGSVFMFSLDRMTVSRTKIKPE